MQDLFFGAGCFLLAGVNISIGLGHVAARKNDKRMDVPHMLIGIFNIVIGVLAFSKVL